MKISLLLFIFTHTKSVLGGLLYQNVVFQIQKYIILKFTYTKKLHLLLVCYFNMFFKKSQLRWPFKDHRHGSNCRLANQHLLLAIQNRHSSEQGIHLNVHSKKITTQQLSVIKSLLSRLYLLFERPLIHNHAKEKLKGK